MHCTDQLNRRLYLPQKPQRVISLVPSQSEFLWDLGLASSLVGITKFCVHPQMMHNNVKRVGGTKQLNMEAIKLLKPDLIIGNKEENEKSQIETLEKDYNVWMSDIETLEDAYGMMLKLGEIFRREVETENLVEQIREKLLMVKNLFSGQRTAYLIWNKPFMLAARQTFIHHVMEYIGLDNAAEELERYPVFNELQLKAADPEYCFLSSEPFPFKQQHVSQLQKILPRAKIILVDGEMFSWYGTRLLKLPAYISGLARTLA